MISILFQPLDKIWIFPDSFATSRNLNMDVFLQNFINKPLIEIPPIDAFGVSQGSAGTRNYLFCDSLFARTALENRLPVLPVNYINIALVRERYGMGYKQILEKFVPLLEL
jgi:hypothetical protein